MSGDTPRYGWDRNDAGDGEHGMPSEHLVRPFLDRVVGAGTGIGAGAEEAAGAGEIRPYLVTQGRTAGRTDIALEAQVMATPAGLGARNTLSFEYRDIVDLVEQPLAVAEVAAVLQLHLGVARVLLGDLQARGMVTTFETDVAPVDDVEMIQRVIDELRQRS